MAAICGKAFVNRTIAILGGSGFVGRRLTSTLVKSGYQVRIIGRQRLLHGDLAVLPGVEYRRTNPYDQSGLCSAIDGCAAVVNLVGILNEKGRKGAGFERAHVLLLENLIAAMQASDIHRLIQMSALRAGEGESHYLKSKGKAESVALESGLAVTLLRPSVIFGPGDSFINRFAQLLKLLPVMPLACPQARFAPVFVGDVAQAATQVLQDGSHIGVALELVGPDEFSLRELVAFVARQLGLKRLIIGLPDTLARMQAGMMDFVPGKPFSTDNYLSLQVDSISNSNDLEKLGIPATSLQTVVPDYVPGSLHAHRLSRFRMREQ